VFFWNILFLEYLYGVKYHYQSRHRHEQKFKLLSVVIAVVGRSEDGCSGWEGSQISLRWACKTV